MKNPLRMRFASLVAALAVALVALVAPASPALAASCVNAGCTGKDPSSTGCSSDAIRLPGSYKDVYTGANPVSVEVRQSATCSARWSRVTIDNELTCCIPVYLSVERQLYTPYGYSRTHYYVKKILAGQAGQFWTNMVDNTADDRFRACYGINDATPDLCGAWVA